MLTTIIIVCLLNNNNVVENLIAEYDVMALLNNRSVLSYAFID